MELVVQIWTQMLLHRGTWLGKLINNFHLVFPGFRSCTGSFQVLPIFHPNQTAPSPILMNEWVWRNAVKFIISRWKLLFSLRSVQRKSFLQVRFPDSPETLEGNFMDTHFLLNFFMWLGSCRKLEQTSISN